MSRRYLLSVVLVFTLPLTCPAQTIEVALAVKRGAEQAVVPRFSCPQFLHRIVEAPPPGEWRFPGLVGPDPRYVMLHFGERSHLMVLDRQKKDDPFFTRAYFDANGDSDLTNDPPLNDSGDSAHSGRHAEFLDIEVQVVSSGDCHPYWFSVLVYGREPGVFARLLEWTGLSTPPELYANAQPACYYEGEFELEDSKYRIALRDANTNGTFTDKGQELDRSQGPLDFRLSLPDSIELSRHGKDPLDLPVADRFLLGKALLAMKLETAGVKLELTPLSEDTIPVAFENPPDSALLKDENRALTLLLCKPSGTVPIPVGEYRLVRYEVSRTAQDGRLWRVAGASGEETPPFMLVEGQEGAAWPYGEPFNPVAVPDPPRIAKGWFGGAVRLRFELQGKGKDRVSTPPECQVGESGTFRAPAAQPPGFKALQADGEVVAQGAFQYG